MVWSGPQVIRNSGLHNPPLIHDHRVVAEVANDAQIVADEEQRQPPFFLEFDQQIEHLGLDADIQCGDRFIADEQLGSAASARAMTMRCLWPPEKASGWRSKASSSRPTAVMSCRASWSALGVVSPADQHFADGSADFARGV